MLGYVLDYPRTKHLSVYHRRGLKDLSSYWPQIGGFDSRTWSNLVGIFWTDDGYDIGYNSLGSRTN